MAVNEWREFKYQTWNVGNVSVCCMTYRRPSPAGGCRLDKLFISNVIDK